MRPFSRPLRPLRGNLGRCLPPDPRHTLIAGVIGPGDGKLSAVPEPLRLLHALRPSATLAAPSNPDALASTLPTILHTVCLAGVWGEASLSGVG